ncbi:MAG TPA: aminopeptidase [Acidiferrobacterales bacterium]|nr:aminopeptidase [Acidiferrobacterales bacterium]
MRSLRILLLLAATMLTGGCTGLGYYSQAIFGQLDILTRTRAIAELLEDAPADDMGIYTAEPSLTPAVKARLAAVLQVRDFATQALALPDNGSYRVYAELDRSQAAWNVVATAEFSLTPIEWCFPVAGCVPYRGYFSHASAQRFAEALKQDRLDVRVAGVAAYSTLGWFRDPVFSTQLRRSDTDIAALIFHELAHQKLYLRGDAAFNESFATTVEIEGIRRWLAQGSDQAALGNYLRKKARHAEFVALLLKFRARLEALYASPLPEEAMRTAKGRDYEVLRAEYVALRNQWGGVDTYDAWFAQDLNNAHLASVGLYHQYVPAFQALLASVQGDLPAFYRLALDLSRLPNVERIARLTELHSAGVTAGK